MAKKTTDNPFDFSAMFDPQNVSKMFDPQAMMDQFGMKMPDFDPQQTIDQTKAQFEAAAKAGEAAAQSYKDLMEKQMAIFQQVSAEAASQVNSANPAQGPEAYQQAIQRALEIMAEMSQNAHEANNKAYAAAKAQVDQTIASLKGK